MLIIWIYFSIFSTALAANNILRTSNCYGDSSGSSSNLIDVSCTSGAVYINDVIAATKPSYLNCPADDHEYSPAEQDKCCTYNESDCFKSFAGSWQNFLRCNGQKTCSRVQVIRDEPICSYGTFPRFSNYMVLEYYCMPDGFNYGPCDTTADCNDPGAACDKSFCACQDGYTTFYAFDDCWKDGGLNGSCTGPVGCQDANTYCNFTSGRCACDVGYIAFNGSCFQGGHNFGFCVDTADCTDPQAMCDTSVCVCVDGYTAFEEFDDCWEDGGLNGSCAGSIGCHDDNTACGTATNRCTCVTGYAPTNGLCYADGELHGYCQTDGDCVDANVTCTDERCECVNGFRDLAGTCRQDGRLNGYCEAVDIECLDRNTTCVNGICHCINGYSDIAGTCKQDGELGGRCVVDSNCTDANAKCVAMQSNSAFAICECINGYADIDGKCIKDGDLHGYCQTNGDCEDSNAVCTDERCECVSGYRDIAGTCRQDGRLNGYCEADAIACLDSNTTCVNGICYCVDGYTDIDGNCKQDGELGGRCVVDSNCTDANAECVAMQSNSALAICECINGYAAINGKCIKDGDLHGYCQTNGDCEDANAVCTDERCECVSGYRDIAGTCRQDGRLNGYCEADAIACLDSNTACVHGICYCVDGYTAIDGTCKQDGELGGRCIVDSNCTDVNAECVAMQSNPALSICECTDGYTDVGGKCIEDGTLHGLCTISVVCKDNNTVCNSTTSRCECSTGYVPYDGTCYADGDLHGFCMQDGDCNGDNTRCTNERCECIDNYRDIDGICREDRHLYGFCEVKVDCVDDSSECLEGICVCIDEYTDIDGTCIKDGELDGACATNSYCSDANAVCLTVPNSALPLCTCTTNYTNIAGVCKQDRRVGGRCTNVNTCLDSLTTCSSQGICECVTGYSEVNSVCEEDGKEGGVCKQIGQGGQGQCTEDNTRCETDTQLQCDGSNCVPGVCQCKNNYDIGLDGTCTKDGDNGGKCNIDSDCKDANANCIGTPLFCICSNGYRDVDGTCVKDGDPGGYCKSGNICSDSHSICVNGTCICNDVRNYILEDGRCKRDDSYINGECQKEDESTCRDANALCSASKCICKTGFSQSNGICTTGNISSVSACNGSSPYNQIAPDCDLDNVPVITETYQRVKPASDNCPGDVNVYSDARFTQCCSYENGDCRLDGSGEDACIPADLSGDYTSYTVMDYVCAQDGSVIDASTDAKVKSNQVYVTISADVTGATGQKTCSVTASCQTDISVQMVFLSFNKVNNQCSQTLTITEGTSTAEFDCDYSVANSEEPVFTTSSGFFTFMITNPDQGGRFVMEIQAETTTADVLVACGNEAATVSPTSFGKCDPEKGRLGGQCSSEITCLDQHTVCQNGICRCIDGYRQFETQCSEIVTEEDKSEKSALLAVVIPVAILVAFAIAGIAFWLLREKIRNKFCPKQEPVPIKPIDGGPSPMNVKYAGRGAPSDVGIPKVMPLPWANSGWSPMNEKFRGNLPNNDDPKTAIPARLPPISSTPMNTKFSGASSTASPKNMADYLYKEELNADKNLRKKKKQKARKNSIGPSDDEVISPSLLANGVAGSANNAEMKKKQKKNKKLKKSKLGNRTKQSFDLPTQPEYTPDGVFTPKPDFYGIPQQGPTLMNGTPTFSQTIHHTSMPYAQTPSGHLPPLSASFKGGYPQVNGGVQSFDPRFTWKTAGAVASVAVQPKVRRLSVLDIHSVDDPSKVERTELSN